MLNPINMLAQLQQRRAAMGSLQELETQLHLVHARRIALQKNCELICASDENKLYATLAELGDSYEVLQIKEVVLYAQLKAVMELEEEILDLEIELQEHDQAALLSTYIELQILPEG